MLQELSEAPVWVQVLTALGIFCFVVAPVFLAVLYVIWRKFLSPIFKEPNGREEARYKLARARIYAELVISALGWLTLMIVFCAYISTLTAIILEDIVLTNDEEEMSLAQLAVIATTASIFTYAIVEHCAKRMDFTNRVWTDLRFAWPGLFGKPLQERRHKARAAAVLLIFTFVCAAMRGVF